MAQHVSHFGVRAMGFYVLVEHGGVSGLLTLGRAKSHFLDLLDDALALLSQRRRATGGAGSSALLALPVCEWRDVPVDSDFCSSASARCATESDNVSATNAQRMAAGCTATGALLSVMRRRLHCRRAARPAALPAVAVPDTRQSRLR